MASQISEAAVTRAEIVHRKAKPHRRQFAQYAQRLLGLSHYRAFSDFKLQPLGPQATLQQA